MDFLETIKIVDGNISHLSYHNRRFNETRKAHFDCEPIDLSTLLCPPSKGLYRCRIVYDENIKSVTYHPYRSKEITKIELVESDIEYAYKYADRSRLDALLKKSYADEVLIVQKGLVTDITIANVAFFYKGSWYTPQEPLLAGTTRARLLDQKKLIPAQIEVKDIKKFEKFAMMNAMVGFKELPNVTFFQRSHNAV